MFFVGGASIVIKFKKRKFGEPVDADDELIFSNIGPPKSIWIAH